MDITAAPDWTWFLCAQYLAAIHNVTWNEEKQCIPRTARDGVTVDISKFLLFRFWDRVLYLDNQDVYPASNERAGYMVGFAENVGDALTFKVYDDQTHRIVCTSVLRPYYDNRRVKFDPELTLREALRKRPDDYLRAKAEELERNRVVEYE